MRTYTCWDSSVSCRHFELSIVVSASIVVSSSHHGELEVASPSDGVWYDEDLEGGVPVQSEAVTKSSASDRLLLQMLFSSCCIVVVGAVSANEDTSSWSFSLFKLTYHSCKWYYNKDSIHKLISLYFILFQFIIFSWLWSHRCWI